MSEFQPVHEGLGEASTVAAVAAREKMWREAKVASRLWKKDPTIWPGAPAAEVPDRCGWLGLPREMPGQLPDLAEFVREVKEAGVRTVVLLGMGGSSLAPHVLRSVFGSAPGHPELRVLDSTHPMAVRSVLSAAEVPHAFFLVSSKSGTTLEPNSFFRYFWHRLEEEHVPPARRFAAITDPGTPLERLARERGFLRTFPATSTVGGRYSALTHFGLVPAALLGVDVGRLLERAAAMAAASGPSVDPPENPGVHLGAVLGELAVRGRNKLTFFASGRLRPFPIWVEQLVAESTGKHGTGIVPIVDEPLVEVSSYGKDRLFVVLEDVQKEEPALRSQVDALVRGGHPVVQYAVEDLYDLGAEMLRWEIAVALSGAVLGIDPFDQPDVESAKEMARKAMAAPQGRRGPEPLPALSVRDPGPLGSAFQRWAQAVPAGGYVALQAFVDPDEKMERALTALRADLLHGLKVATMSGFGPRFLHSTGQLHKGGPANGGFLQIIDEPGHDVAVPGDSLTFDGILRAQALGDAQVLVGRGRPVLRVDLNDQGAAGIERLREIVVQAFGERP